MFIPTAAYSFGILRLHQGWDFTGKIDSEYYSLNVGGEGKYGAKPSLTFPLTAPGVICLQICGVLS